MGNKPRGAGRAPLAARYALSARFKAVHRRAIHVSAPVVVYRPRPSRPLGVAILAVLIGIFGAFLLIAALLLLLGGGLGLALPTLGPVYGGVLVGGIILLVLAVLLFVVARGLWELELWALVLAIIVLVFELLALWLAGRLLSVEGIIAILLLVYLIAVHGDFR